MVSWPITNEEWRNVTPDFIKQFVRNEGGAFDTTFLVDNPIDQVYGDFEWVFDPEYPVSKLSPIMPSIEDWKKWFDEEQKYYLDRDPLYYPSLVALVRTNPEDLNPIICVEFKNPQPSFVGPPYIVNIGDGWPRTAISVIERLPTIRAIVGKHKTL